MPFLYQFGEELQEERDCEQSYVHTVDIGIGSHNHFVVAECLKTVFNVECCLQEVKFLVLIDHLLGQSVGVQRFSAQ